LILICCTIARSFGQGLPTFKAIDKNGTTIISWEKPSETLTLLVIQRSIDSLNGFKSIASMPDPNTPQNGYVDRGNKSLVHFYRIFYVSANGKYYFTNSKKAVIETIQPTLNIPVKKDSISVPVKKQLPIAEKQTLQVVNFIDTAEVITKKKLIESVLTLKADTIDTRSNIKIITEKIGPVNNLSPNPFLFVNKENNLMLVLPQTNKRKFNLQVWKENGQTIFHMKNIRESQLLIDKSNFIFSGWFKYEISEGERVKEKGKFFINAD
jgi:hypothetical protein